MTRYSTPLLLGLFAFLLVMGIKPLYPQNVAWLNGLDPIQHYIGWAFYRFGPWTFPVGLNPGYGMELSSSIVFTDSIPLLAILFKPFSGLLPQTFQYLGIWTLVCFVLQAYFAGRLMGLITSDRLIVLLGSAFFVFAPPMLWRMGYHTALASHFLILAALYLNLKPAASHHIRNWACLIVVASLVHFYILAMVMALWIADLLDRSPFGNKSDQTKTQESTQLTWFAIGKELFIVLLLLLGAMWQAGYFISVSTSGAGYGLHRTNVLSMFYPQGWSYIGRLWSQENFPVEGFNFLGLGLVLVFVFALTQMALVLARRKPFLLNAGRFRWLILVMLSLALFSWSHHIGFGSITFELAVPEIIIRWASVLRSSGRMFWPVLYFVIFLSLLFLVRHLSKKIVITVFSLLLLIQIIDTSSAWWPRRIEQQRLEGAEFSSSFKDVFWSSAANHYKKWVSLPLVDLQGQLHWISVGVLALRHRFETNAVYLARYNSADVRSSNQTLLNALYQGRFNPQTLYILDDSKVLAAQMHIRPDDLLAKIDGLNVLAPGWKSCKDCLQVPASMEIRSPMPTLGLGKPISFGTGALGPSFLIWGWAEPEPWGAWSIGKQSKLVMPMPQGAKSLTLDMRALIGANHPVQGLELIVNGVGQSKVSLSKPDHNRIQIPLTQIEKQEKYVAIQLNYLNPVKPKTLGQGPDERDLAIGINSAMFE